MALMIIIAAIVMGATFLTLRSFNAAAMKADRYRVTQEALDQAKAGLIARAVAEDDLAQPQNVRPGSLPCPDTNDDGNAELFVGNECPSYVGRLPWRTLNLPDLRDASGERLWYALSRNFRDDTSAQPINSNTVGTLTVAGNQPATALLAIVIAPGGTLRRADGVSQVRACPGASCYVASNYLDIVTTLGIDNADIPAFVSADESDTFNDRLLPIYSDDILPLVERRAGNEYAKKLREHFDKWQTAALVTGTKGFYPWAAPFSDPSINAPGVSGTTTGSLPMSAASVTWTSATSTIGSCTGVGTSQINCGGLVLCIFSACLLNINARVGNLATAFVDPPTASSVLVTGLTLGGATSSWSMDATGQALNFSFNSGSFLGVAVLNVRVNAPAATEWTTGIGADQWLVNNSWGQVTYYALSPRYALNGNANCAATPLQCLTVTNGTTNATNKQALVVTAGRPLPAPYATPQARPAGVATLANYLESQNLTPTDFLFQQGMRSTQFNDQPAVAR